MNARVGVLLGLVLAAAASRLLPHPPNVTPVAALALFGGAHFGRLWQACAVPLGAMLLSDLVIGLHALIPFVYGSLALAVLIGIWVGRRLTPGRVAAGAVGSSVLFFLVTNFGVWAQGALYPRTADGLLAAYVAALPFFRNTVAGDLFYAAVLFGGFALLERAVPALRTRPGVMERAGR
ncbi:MAG: DUF6580 family putative transport protein [Armatimonadota bacterium]|nr:DUF6580 family putative transport protein [Armatimonadota bacterium]MDR7401473.1 DUF6580 family putative transport protein [Armatimonadota bacterium]MDR7405066.1 DUF6580 family putative transport protein [Armatimonadota bacterium]MDR7437512.1 DUF6580 family putative transport protein [Armatimonadota bacterium]MDR7471719.1 DUF6580 family putative transport protein [Armatimonadota bacterium]